MKFAGPYQNYNNSGLYYRQDLHYPNKIIYRITSGISGMFKYWMNDISLIHFLSKEDAMRHLDEYLIRRGYKLLLQDQWDKLIALI